ncbi:MAG: hypothetical protein ACRD2L_24105 [Terriglobia bacterium]
MAKKAQTQKMNQVAKALSRFKKITLHRTMLKRANIWFALEPKAEERERLDVLRKVLHSTVEMHAKAQEILGDLVTQNYAPAKKSTSGELQFKHGRKVWIKQKYLDIYIEAYPEEALQRLFVDKVVKGRVVLSVGEPDKDGNMTPRIMAPKIHVTGTQ